MTIILPKHDQVSEAIHHEFIPAVTPAQAQHEDIRALRIGLINVSDQSLSKQYEINLLDPLGRSVMQIEPVWIMLSDEDHLHDSIFEKISISFKEAISNHHLDGLILIGPPVLEPDLTSLADWPEISRILRYAHNNIPCTLGIGAGAMAIAAFLELPVQKLDKHTRGLFSVKNLNTTHPITCIMDDLFWCPFDQFVSIPDDAFQEAENQGRVDLLAYSENTGYVLAESSDHRFLMHCGYPVYEIETFFHKKENSTKATDIVVPQNFDTSNPVNIWRGHRTALFSQWIQFIHQATTF